MNNENECYRGDDCQQANEGQQIVGKDNEAVGFNDQSKNLQRSVIPTQPPTPGPSPTTTILNVCKEVTNTATTDFQPSDFIFAFSTPANPDLFRGADEGCTAVTVSPGTYQFREIRPVTTTIFGIALSSECGSFSSFGAIIQGTIAAGETRTCTVFNIAIP